ncbi:MAG: hypothetical protein J3R72DRAFT_61984 [Linnemannia gamsii]|nr:MAG: hypothetical protein J3R72DRAFT_61984 [Linnemannia gamsii]
MSRQRSEITDTGNADTDIVIAVGNHTVPATPTSPTTASTGATAQVQSDSMRQSTALSSTSTSSERTNSTILPPLHQQQQQQQGQNFNDFLQGQEAASRPLPFVHQPPTFAAIDDPSTSYTFPNGSNHSTTGVSNGYSPTLRSEVLSGHQQSSMPYVSSASRSEYPPFTSSYRTPAPYTQALPHHGHNHRIHHGHDHDPMSSTNVMSIDYDGLDASVHEAGLIESGFLEPQPVLDYKEQAPSPGGLDRAVSSGSASGGFGSSFRRRSARKASYYSERSPRVRATGKEKKNPSQFRPSLCNNNNNNNENLEGRRVVTRP